MPRTDQRHAVPQAFPGRPRRVENRRPFLPHPSSFILHTFLLLCFSLTAQAGDILRGGATSANGRKAADARANAGAQAAEIAKIKAADRLARTTKILSDMRQMQAAAQAAGSALSVPDGLVPGGLERLPGGKWTGALAPTQSGGNVNIKQTASQALLDWKTFNVGKNTTLNFDQSAGGNDSGKWIAFNKVFDPSGVPSKILGKINADGQVYIINQNGIIFGSGSQVNARTFVASSLPINDNLVARGILNQEEKNARFLFDGRLRDLSIGSGQIGSVTVETGASLSAPTNDAKSGGRIILVGPSVENSGSIYTPDGQTILAAGLQVGFDASTDASLRGLKAYVGKVSDLKDAANNSVIARAATVGAVTNSGLIETPRGNTVIAGSRISQLGAIESSTSVALNGRVDLLANFNAFPNPDFAGSNDPFLNGSTGTILLGKNSLIRILPDWASDEKVIGTKLALNSKANMQARNVHFGSGSVLLAPSADVSVQTGMWLTSASASAFTRSVGQIYIDQKAMIDVSGSTNIKVPVSQSILELELRGAELSRSPSQRNGILRGLTLAVDIRQSGTYGTWSWVGTPLGDISGFAGLIERNVGQLTISGGSITLSSGEAVVVQQGAALDVSGGYIEWQGGKIATSRVRSGMSILDISKAMPDRVYDGLYTPLHTKSSSKWGVSKTYRTPLDPSGEHYEQTHVEGANAGAISVTSPIMALDGHLSAHVIEGPTQLRQNTSSVQADGAHLVSKISQTSKLPNGGALSLVFTTLRLDSGGIYRLDSPAPPTIAFRDGSYLPAVDRFFEGSDGAAQVPASNRISTVILSPTNLEEEGFSTLVVENSGGDILLPKGTMLRTRSGGAVTLKGKNIAVDGSIIVPSGKISLSAYNISPYAFTQSQLAALPSPNAQQGIVHLGGSGLLDVSGLLSDDRPTSAMRFLTPVSRKGGTVTVEAFSIVVDPGGAIDASSSVGFSSSGKIQYGSGGSITLKAGQDPTLKALLGGKLVLGGELRGYGGLTGSGGSLSLQAQTVQIGGTSEHAGTLVLSTDFFNQGGFANFTLTGIGEADAKNPGGYIPGVLISKGSRILPVVKSLGVTPFSSGGQMATRVLVEPPANRTPANLKFISTGAVDGFSGLILARGDIVMAASSSIVTDPLGSVAFDGQTVTVLGTVDAPGGTISVKGAPVFPSTVGTATALATVHLGPSSRLSTAGVVLLTPDPYGRSRGSVLPGGTISVEGNIVAEAGALLNVSGTSGVLDLRPSEMGLMLQSQKVSAASGVNAPLYALHTNETRIESDAGVIVLNGGEMLYSDATLLGNAGGISALGGSLFVSSGKFSSGDSYDNEINLSVSQTLPALTGQSKVGIGLPVRDGAAFIEHGYFAVSTFEKGGFDVLALDGNVAFEGPVSLTVARALHVGTGGVIYADSDVSLTAPYVALGQEFRDPVYPGDKVQYFGKVVAGTPGELFFPPTFGPGSLTVTAELLDLGTLSLQNIGRAALNAPNGDIRGSGTLNIRGDLTIAAGQIYPATTSVFNIIAYDPNAAGGVLGSVTINSGTSRPLPYSAGGELNIYASSITQGGTLRAPMGAIHLGWDGTGTAPSDPITGNTLAFPVAANLTLSSGSITSVSGKGLLIPYGISADGNSWLDPRGFDITSSGLKSKEITLSARNLTTAQNSLVDISGGGDLLAFRWVEGNGGPEDILASSSSYVVLPGYEFGYTPFAKFNTKTGDPGFVNSGLSVGDKVYLSGGGGLAAGYYTLLPARYGVLPGAFLVTPSTSKSGWTVNLSDGANLVSGYRFNALGANANKPALKATFEVASSAVFLQRAEYDTFIASTFLSERATELGVTTQRLPNDAGSLVFQAQTGLSLMGTVVSTAATGRGATIDISTPMDIFIGDSNAVVPPGTTLLDSSLLSRWGAESLLVGGRRTAGTSSTSVAVRTGHITVDNEGAPLSGPEIILVATDAMTFADNSSVVSSGSLSSGGEVISLTGDGLLARISADVGVQTNRTGTTSSNTPLLSVGAGVRLAGQSVTLDSSARFVMDDSALIESSFVKLSAGRISIQLDAPGSLQADAGLVLGGLLLDGLSTSDSLTLQSYSSVDFYGFGTFGQSLSNLRLQSRELRGFNTAGNDVALNAGKIVLENPGATVLPGSVAPATGDLHLTASVVEFGAGAMRVGQFHNLVISASDSILGRGTGEFTVTGNLLGSTPLITGVTGATTSIISDGVLSFSNPGGTSTITPGLGASLTLAGVSIAANTDIILPSGLVTLHASTGDVVVGGKLQVYATAQRFYDVVKYTDAGEIRMFSDSGNITFGAGSEVSVAAASGGGNSGYLDVRAPGGIFSANGLLSGAAVAGARSGGFNMDVGSIVSFFNINQPLQGGGFLEERIFRIRTGNVLISETAKARNFVLSTDAGDITVASGGFIDAGGTTGGNIALVAQGSVTLESGAKLSVSGQQFSSAGKGGAIRLEAGAATDSGGTVTPNLSALLDLQGGSFVDLSVAGYKPGSYTDPTSSAFLGQFQGTLHLRAPRTAGNNDLRIAAINTTITGASSIVAEGYELYTQATVTNGLITGWRSTQNALPTTGTLQRTVYDSANAFLSPANYAGMTGRLLGADSQGLGSMFVLAPGVEIVNSTGNLALGLSNDEILSAIGGFSTGAANQVTSLGSALIKSADWNLADFRFGPKLAPGVLTLRASGNVVFNNALSDGFAAQSVANAATRQTNANSSLWRGELKDLNALLPINTQSWTYRITAGSDLSAANSAAVLPNGQLALNSGSIFVGEFYAAVPNVAANAIGYLGQTSNSLRITRASGSSLIQDLGTRYEVIRTGTGDILMNAGRDIQLRNQFATVYTAGVRIPDPKNLYSNNDFRPPTFYFQSTSGDSSSQDNNDLGAAQQFYGQQFVDENGQPRRIPQWSLAGGNISIRAGSNLGHYLGTDSGGNLIVDATRQQPTNWLFRRGEVEGSEFGSITYNDLVAPAASTTWWVDYSNFFEGVGTLGGGDIDLVAGNDIINVDAAAPTNARTTYRTASGDRLAANQSLVELGGGDVTVRTGNNIDGGIYYVERGSGSLLASGEITTNQARSPSFGIFQGVENTQDAKAWLPTTLFLGKGAFSVSARKSVLIGPTLNPFLLPAGLNNKPWYATYFNTYAPTSSVDVSSLGGSITHRLAATLDLADASSPIFWAWLKTQNLFTAAPVIPAPGQQQDPADAKSAAYFQPWIRLAESNLEAFTTTPKLAAPTLRSISFGGDVNVVGDLNLFPSPTGTLEMLAAGQVVGLQATGFGQDNNQITGISWASSRVNLSDADPNLVNGVLSPTGRLISGDPLLEQFFDETGSSSGASSAINVKQALHARGVLHAGDPRPVRMYAAGGDITGLALFSGKSARILASRDITDVAFYIQNTGEEDVSIVSAGRDVVPYNANTALRTQSGSSGNIPGTGEVPLAGDIQISGPGSLQVLAGRKIDLGTGAVNSDGTGAGITSIGNARNPYLPAQGAHLVVGAGLGSVASGLGDSSLNLEAFIEQYVTGGTGDAYLEELMVDDFESLSLEEQNRVALEVFYLVLRDAGRAVAGGEPDGYADGFAAIDMLFSEASTGGDILARSRDIRTKSGGNISLFAPGGKLELSSTKGTGDSDIPPGVVTESGGNINIFTENNVDIGIGRIFTLRGGDIIIWSSSGDIAAGTSSKTVQSAPPTRVMIDPQSGYLETDLAGLATGGGIGVLATVAGLEPGDVDLIAPVGTVDAGDAGIRATGNLSIAATTVLNAGNISTGGASSGVPSAPTVAAPNVGGLTSASSSSAAANNAASSVANQATQVPQEMIEAPSIITVEVLGYGGGEDEPSEG
jgi:filamentous hemagglutinin